MTQSPEAPSAAWEPPQPRAAEHEALDQPVTGPPSPPRRSWWRAMHLTTGGPPRIVPVAVGALLLAVGGGVGAAVTAGSMGEEREQLRAELVAAQAATTEVRGRQLAAEGRVRELTSAQVVLEGQVRTAEARTAEYEQRGQDLDRRQQELDARAAALGQREAAVGQAEAAERASSFGSGIHVVGRDIQPGTYRADASRGCYYAWLDGAGEIVDNDFRGESGPVTVTIRSSAARFESNGCGTWRKIG